MAAESRQSCCPRRRCRRGRRGARLPLALESALAACLAALVLSPATGTDSFCLALNMPPLDDRAPIGSGSGRHTSDFRARRNHPTTYDDSPPFRGPIVFGRGDGASDAKRERVRHFYLDEKRSGSLTIPAQPRAPLGESTPTKSKLKAIVDHLAYRDAPVDVKEVAESVEFYLRTRKRLLGAAARRNQQGRHPVVVYDLCSGHGLTGMLFAACNAGVRTVLVDRSEPRSHGLLKRYLAEVCPWLGQNDGSGDVVQFIPATLEALRGGLSSNCASHNNDAASPRCSSVVISTHACGSLTDQVLEYAVESRAAGVAVMPCCYTGTDRGAPYSVRRALGVAWSADVRRSFYLQERGYHPDFAAIPPEITPMNRILVGERRSL